jgi:high-affinity Fe2+/Pb2+ permease
MRLTPTVRGLAILVVIAAVITAAGASSGLTYVLAILNVVFLVAIAWLLYRLWRSNREQISYWSRRSRAVFYGAALLAIANIVASFALPYPETGLEAVVFFAVLIACAYAMWRVWRDEHSYA